MKAYKVFHWDGAAYYSINTEMVLKYGDVGSLKKAPKGTKLFAFKRLQDAQRWTSINNFPIFEVECGRMYPMKNLATFGRMKTFWKLKKAEKVY